MQKKIYQRHVNLLMNQLYNYISYPIKALLNYLSLIDCKHTSLACAARLVESTFSSEVRTSWSHSQKTSSHIPSFLCLTVSSINSLQHSILYTKAMVLTKKLVPWIG